MKTPELILSVALLANLTLKAISAAHLRGLQTDRDAAATRAAAGASSDDTATLDMAVSDFPNDADLATTSKNTVAPTPIPTLPPDVPLSEGQATLIAAAKPYFGANTCRNRRMSPEITTTICGNLQHTGVHITTFSLTGVNDPTDGADLLITVDGNTDIDVQCFSGFQQPESSTFEECYQMVRSELEGGQTVRSVLEETETPSPPPTPAPLLDLSDDQNAVIDAVTEFFGADNCTQTRTLDNGLDVHCGELSYGAHIGISGGFYVGYIINLSREPVIDPEHPYILQSFCNTNENIHSICAPEVTTFLNTNSAVPDKPDSSD